MEEKKQKARQKKEKCPLCEIDEETLKILKEKGKNNKTKEKSQDGRK